MNSSLKFNSSLIVLPKAHFLAHCCLYHAFSPMAVPSDMIWSFIVMLMMHKFAYILTCHINIVQFASLLLPYSQVHTMSSWDTYLLTVPPSWLRTTRDRAFSVAVEQFSSLSACSVTAFPWFKIDLKAHHFHTAFPPTQSHSVCNFYCAHYILVICYEKNHVYLIFVYI